MKWKLAIALLMWSFPVQAQVRPDQTLPQNSIATPNRNTINITGGTTAGSNLFHSFERFDVRNGAIVHFQNADAIDNIFSRVTGNNPSRIDGLIRANGTANLFLLNPNGILFGENAALNIGGSFLATTADRIDFADGTSFRATPQSTPLLTVSAPIGLQFGSNPGAIVNESIAETSQPLGTDDSFVGLSVNPGETLALIGGDIRLPGGELTAPAGQIELGSVASASRVQLTPNRTGWQFDYADVQAFGDITLSAAADVDASGDRGGRIRLWGDRILLTDGLTFVRADTLGAQDGAGILIRSTQLVIQDGASIRANTVAAGQGGNISLIVVDSIVLQDVERGRNGEPIVVDGRPVGASGLFARVQPGATGSGGNISIATNRLSVLAGAQISTSTLSVSPAGSMTVRASAVDVAGVAVNSASQPILSGGVSATPSTLSTFAATTAAGRAGDLSIFTDRLTVRDGATIQTSTQGVGNAGNLQIEAIESIELIGTLGSAQSPTGLLTFSGGIPDLPFSSNNRNATGRGGRLSITTGAFILRDGAVVAVGSLNPSSEVSAGNVRIEADTLRLDRQAAILANTNSGNGGSAIFDVENAIVLQGNSRISTTAGVAGSGGNGGNIRINTDFILSTLPEDNDITANAFTGNGGNVTIAARGILGIAPQDRPTAASDITASSEFGNSGAIVITNPTDDPSQGLVELPANLIDASRQIAQSCGSGATARQSSEFVVTGRGGLPPSPIDSRSSAAILSQWATLSDAGEAAAVATPAVPSIVEAQGWVTTANGEVRLVAAAPIAPVGVAIACR